TWRRTLGSFSSPLRQQRSVFGPGGWSCARRAREQVRRAAMRSTCLVPAATLAAALLVPVDARAQGTAGDYERANGLRAKYEALVNNVPGPATWIEKTNHFWYRRSVKGGSEFMWFDADTQQKRPAFDHARLATALATATKAPAAKYTAATLPFNTIAFVDSE